MADDLALLHQAAASDYGVSFPDFPGCVTAGETLDEARRLAGEALALHLRGLLEDGETLPPPSSLADVMADRANREAVAFLVSAPERALCTVRVNITLPEDELRAIDRYAEAHGLTRSGFLVRAAKKAMRRSERRTP